MTAKKCVLVLCILLTNSVPSAFGVLVYQSESVGGISTFETTTGVTIIRGSSPVGTMDGLAFSPSGVLYGIHGVPTPSPDNGSVYTIDPSTGKPTLVGHTGLIAQGLAFGLDGTLYTVAGENLYSIDPTNAQLTLLRSGLHYVKGLTVAPVDVQSSAGIIRRGSIVGAQPTTENGGTTFIYSIDKDSLNEKLVHTVPLSVVDETLEFDADGTLFGNNHSRSPTGSGWWIVDLVGNNHQLVGVTHALIWGSAIAPSVAVPEPQAWLCGAVLLLMTNLVTIGRAAILSLRR